MASKSLGTLTLDLVAKTGNFVEGMTKAERASEKWRRNAEKNAKMVGRALGLAAAASVTALTAMVTVSIRQADESRKLAQAAGLSTEAFTALTFAAGQSGVAQTELVAATGRLNRSMLEAATGTKRQEEMFRALGIAVVDASGNLRDGDKVLKDLADRFQQMPDGAQKSAMAMDLLGRSGAKMIPLLNGGSEGIEKLTRQAEALGLVISDKTAQQAELFNDSLAVLGGLSKGVANQLAAEFLPILSDLVAGFAEAATEGDLVANTANRISGAVKTTTNVVIGAAAAFDLTGKALGGLAAVIAAIPRGWSAVSAVAKEVVSDLDETAQRYASAMAAITNAGASGGQSERVVRDMASMLRELRESNDGTAAAVERNAEAIAKQVAQLQFQSMHVHKSADELTLLKLAADGATQSQLALAESALANIAAFNAQTEAEKAMVEEMKRINSEAAGIAQALQTEEESIRSSYERRREIILKNTEITGQARQNLLLRLENETNEKLEELNRGYWGNYLAAMEENFANMDTLTADMLNNLTSGFGNAFEAMIFDAESLEDAVYKLASGMLRSIVNALGQMAGQWIAYQAVQLAMGQSTQAAVAATSAATGTAIASAYAPAAAMASLASFGANSAPAMAGITATASLAKGLSLVGMAHDGIDSVPQTGTWLLQKGERVTTADTSAKLDKTLSGLQSGMSGGMGKNIRIVNAWDTSMIGDYMGSSSGEEVIMNAVRRNQRTIRSLAS
jgi:phosphate uptake regulator